MLTTVGILKLIAVLVLACGLLVWYFTYLWKSSGKLFEKIDAVRELAKKAFTKEELQYAWDELVKVNKECWNTYQSSEIREISAIIETKYEMLCKK